MASVQRTKELKRRRQRSAKIQKLRMMYAKAKTEEEKAVIIAKVKKIAIWIPEEEFLAPLKAS